MLTAAATAATVVSMVLARQQVAVWANSVDLWEHTLQVTHDNYRAQNNLAHALVAAGKSQEAFSHYEAALRINPDSVEAHTGIGAILGTGRQAGRGDRALSPGAAGQSHRCDHAGQSRRARSPSRDKSRRPRSTLRAAVAAAPDLPQARSYLGVTLARTGQDV